MATYRVEGTISTDVYLYVEASSEEEATVEAEGTPGEEWQESATNEVEIIDAHRWED